MKKLNLSEKELQKRLDFLKANQSDIVKLWESNQPQKGYVIIAVNNDLKPYFMEFKASKVKTSTFMNLTKGEKYALCEVHWNDTDTKNRVSFGYSLIKSEIQIN